MIVFIRTIVIIVTAYTADRYGRSIFRWILWSLCLGIIAYIALLIIGKTEKKKDQEEEKAFLKRKELEEKYKDR